MLSANFQPKRTAAASRGFLATARLSCFTVWFYPKHIYVAYNTVCAGCLLYMPPPKRPKSDVQWTALCTEIELEHETSVNTRNHVDNTIATLSTASPTSCTECVPAVSNELPLDLRRTDTVSDGDRHVTGDGTGSRHPSSSTSLRRLLLEPLAPAFDLYQSPSSRASASAVVVGTQRKCRSKAADVIEKPVRCPTSQKNVGLDTQSVVVPSAADDARQTVAGSSSNLPIATLRRILLNDNDVDDGRKRPQPSVTSVYQSSDCLFLRLASGGSCSPWSSGSTGPAVARALPQQSITSCNNLDGSQTASLLFSKYAQLTDRLESGDSGVSGEGSKSVKQRRETSNGLK